MKIQRRERKLKMENTIVILLVEDDPNDVRMTVRELEKNCRAIRIDVVRDGEEALDYLLCQGAYHDRPPSARPQLILMDLNLPKVGGLQVIQEIKRRTETKAIPVVALTSSAEEKDVAESYKLGVNSYIQKPVDFDEFRQAIRTLGLYWTEHNQAPPIEAFTA